MNLRQFDLNLLVALDALLRERNVTHAGQQLCLSQSAMSGKLARLRSLFDDDLLVRVGRHLELTPLAQELAGPVREHVRQIEDLLNAKRAFVPETEKRLFQIAATDYSVLLMLGPLVNRLEELAPGITVRFVKLDPNAREGMASGGIDFSILPEEIETGLASVPLFKDPWVCIAWAGHPGITNKLTLKNFLAQPHMVFNLGDASHNSVADEYLMRQGYKRNIVASTESLTNAPFLLQGTTMITMVPRRLAERLKVAADIKLFTTPMRVPPLAEKLVWSPRFNSSRGHAWMRERIVEIAASL